MENYDYWRTMSDVDYEDSCNTECYDTDEDYKCFMEVLNYGKEKI